MGSIAKHSSNLAEAVVEAEVFPNVLIHMSHPDENVAKAATILTKEVCKHTPKVSFAIVTSLIIHISYLSILFFS